MLGVDRKNTVKFRYRIDSKYERFKEKLIEFFKKQGYPNMEESANIPLGRLDIVITKNGKGLVEGGEIKTRKESKYNYGSWYSYHKEKLKNLPNIDKLSPQAKGFAATVYGQMRDYVSKLPVNELWLIQEGEEFMSHIDEALRFLEGLGEISLKVKELYKDLLFYKVRFGDSVIL